MAEHQGKRSGDDQRRRSGTSQMPLRAIRTAALGAALVLGACVARGGDEPPGEAEAPVESAGVSRSTPVALALEVEGGMGVPLRVRAGQRFFLNQIDLRVAIEATADEGVAGLAEAGDFADLPWEGVALRDAYPPAPNGNGTFTHKRFYRSAAWMEQNSSFTLTQIDRHGNAIGEPVTVSAGTDNQRSPEDGFFVRRFRAIQTLRDCPSATDCSGASSVEEEALVELRNAMEPRNPFNLHKPTTALLLTWSLRPDTPYLIPVEQIEAPAYDYGFSIDVAPLTAPGPDGVYPPGQDITFQLTLRDGSGARLHPEGSLPTYNEVVFGPNEAGIQYYRAFFDPTHTYWRRKHRERMLMTQIIGPAQNIQPIRSVVELGAFLDEEDVEHIGTLERDGVFSDFMTFPPANDLFGGAFDPTHAGWAAPVSDTWTFHLPEDAPAGTYLVTVKGRRVYLGEDIPFTRTIELQVGSAVRTAATLTTGPCNSCHSKGGELGTVLHANDNRAACAGCHAPLGFELEGPIHVRTHFLHSRSDRVGTAAVGKCANCHLTAESIQRTSKAACLSCHTSYPADHVAQFGPVQHAYVGGGAESFQPCTNACHTTHPGSAL